MRKFTKFFLSLMAMLMVTVSANAWKFTLTSPSAGEVESLGYISLKAPAGTMFIDETGAVPCMMQKDGVDLKTWNMADAFNMDGTVAGNAVDYAAVEDPGTYTLVIPAGAFHINNAANEAQTFTWTIKGSAPAGPDYTVSYDKANGIGIVKLTWPEGTVLAAADVLSGSMHPTIPGYEGYIVGGNWNTPNVIEVSVTLAEGDWTINFPAGDFTINGTPNAAISETFTVSGGTQGGGETFEGEKSHEQIFKAGETPVTKNNIVLESDGVKITTVDGEFNLGGSTTTIPFGYNTYDEKELDWNNKCKFVITAKKDAISKIIFVPTASGQEAIAKASADKGEYNNGVWEGKLAAGETLTLTASDGIQIKDIYVCYNGDDFDPSSQADEKGTITISWPTENMELASISDGGTLAKFTTNKDYAQVTVELRNVNSTWHNLYDLPMRYMDGLAAGEHTCTTSTPGTSDTGGNPAWKTFIGDSYELVIKGYVNYWDNDYDAMAVVHVVGTGKEHEVLSTYQIIKITPETATDLNVEAPRAKLTTARDNTVTFEFDGPVSAMTASVPAGAAGGSGAKLSCAKANDEGTIWNITVTSGDIGADESFFFNVTAKDNEGHFLDINPASSEHTLGLFFEVTSDDIQDGGQASLGAPAFSIANDAEDIDPATTTSISVTFPNATGYASGVVATVHGTLAKNDMSEPVSFEEKGTVAGGVTVPVTLEADKAYTFTVTSIALAENTTVEGETFLNLIGTYNTNYNVLFYTAGGQGGGTGDNILGEATFTAGENGITISFPNADFSSVEDMGVEVTSVQIKAADGNVYEKQYANFDTTNGLTITVSYDEAYRWNENYSDMIFMPAPEAGDELTVTIPAYNLNIYHDYNDWSANSKFGIAYQNEEPITGTVTVPGDEPQPTSVVLYDYANGDRTTLDGKARSITKDGVTLTATGSNNYTVPAEGGNFNGLRIGRYVTVAISADTEIEKIEITTNGTVWSDDVTNLNAGSFSGTEWTGSSKEVTFKTSADQTVSKIVVTLAGAGEQAEARMVIGSAMYGTFVAPFDVDIPAGVKAYTVGKLEDGALSLSELTATIPAHTPVVVNSESSYDNTFKGTAVTGSANPTAGDLVGTYEDGTQVPEDCYVLQMLNGKVAFYRVMPETNVSIDKNRCYLTAASSNARAAYFFTEEDATAINGINADVLGAEGIYNASGVRVNSLQKGLNIIKTANGTKKVMIK